jgi:hypothetical protein
MSVGLIGRPLRTRRNLLGYRLAAVARTLSVHRATRSHAGDHTVLVTPGESRVALFHADHHGLIMGRFLILV